MAQDEPIRLTAEEAQQVIEAQRREIAGLRQDLWRCLRSIEGLHQGLQNEMRHHAWLKDYGGR